MPRAATRSKKPAPAQSQNVRAGGSRRRVVDDDDDEEEQDEEPTQQHSMDVDDDDDEGNNGDSELNRKANDLVRLALFMEHKRTALRREEITKKVLGANNARAFNVVMAAAQDRLQQIFGMELVELPSRAGVEQEANAPSATQANGEDELHEARKATGMKKKAATLMSKTYIVRSCLDPLLIEHAALTDEKILEYETKDAPSDMEDDADEDDDDEERPPRHYGSLISWTQADQLSALGILYVVLSLILVNGRVINDQDLRSHLKRLRLHTTPGRSPVHFTTTSTHRSLSTDAYLSQLLRQGYLDRQLVGDSGKAKKGPGGGKRVRAVHADDADDGKMYEWRWGTRAMCEVGEQGIAKFIGEFMVGDADEEDEEEDEADGAAERREREEKMQRMMKGIERSAGGNLAELR